MPIRPFTQSRHTEAAVARGRSRPCQGCGSLRGCPAVLTTPRPPSLAVREDVKLLGAASARLAACPMISRNLITLKGGRRLFGDLTQPRHGDAATVRRQRRCPPARRFHAASPYQGRRRSRPGPPLPGSRLARRFHAASSLQGCRCSRPKKRHSWPAPHLPGWRATSDTSRNLTGRHVIVKLFLSLKRFGGLLRTPPSPPSLLPPFPLSLSHNPPNLRSATHHLLPVLPLPNARRYESP